MATQVLNTCDEEGCDWEGTACFYPDNPIYGLDYPEGGPPIEAEPDHYYCSQHAHKAGFCFGCGSFWGGVESFDFGLGARTGLCENCQSSGEYEDEDMDEVYETYPFDAEDDWNQAEED